jgi:hypothetical protein
MLIPLLLGLLVVWGDQVFDHFLLLVIGYGAIFGAIWSAGRARWLERSTAGAGRALRIACTGLCGGGVAGSLAGPVAFLLALERDTPGMFKDLVVTRSWQAWGWELGTAIVTGAWIGTLFAAAGGVIAGLLTIYLLSLLRSGKSADGGQNDVAVPHSDANLPTKRRLLGWVVAALYLALLAGPAAWLGYHAFLANRERQAEIQWNSSGTIASYKSFIGPDWAHHYRAMLGNDGTGLFWRADMLFVDISNKPCNWSVLSSFTALEVLTVGGKNMTDEELSRLVQQLKPMDQDKLTISLRETSITDKGLKQLAELPQLTRLSLYNMPISDAGLKQLGDVPNLNYVELLSTRVTPAGVTALQVSRPALRINASAGAAMVAPPPPPQPGAAGSRGGVLDGERPGTPDIGGAAEEKNFARCPK